MFHRLRTRVAVISSTTLLTVVTILAFGNSQAFAENYTAQLCDSNGTTTACVNAWYGGPAVNVYTGMGAEPNDEFYIGTLNNGNTYIEFLGGTPDYGLCIGDFNNNPGYADTGLVQCPTNTNSGGWGTNFQLQSCGGSSAEGFAFKNNHWNGGYLAAGAFSNGTPYYLNHSGQWCFGTYDWGDKG